MLSLDRSPLLRRALLPSKVLLLFSSLVVFRGFLSWSCEPCLLSLLFSVFFSSCLSFFSLLSSLLFYLFFSSFNFLVCKFFSFSPFPAPSLSLLSTYSFDFPTSLLVLLLFFSSASLFSFLCFSSSLSSASLSSCLSVSALICSSLSISVRLCPSLSFSSSAPLSFTHLLAALLFVSLSLASPSLFLSRVSSCKNCSSDV